MLLIPDNSTLRAFIPNTMKPAMGETSLFDKIRPFIVAAEDWFKRNFIPHDLLRDVVENTTDENDPFYFLPRRIVVLKAWRNAIPSIDIVVGPTGMGVTETASLKPASKAKVENLLKATESELDYNIESLINIIYKIPGWLDSAPANIFRSSLFPDFSILDALGIKTDRYNEWLRYIRQASTIEQRIARNWISVPTLARLRSALLARESKGEFDEVARLVRNAVLEELRTGHEQTETIEDATNLIRSNVTLFPEWPTTDTASRFSVKAYRNHKHDKGYWF